MVKKILFVLFSLFFLLYATLFFLPKRELYFYGERLLKREGVVISQESIKEKAFGLIVRRGVLYYHDIMIANIDTMVLQSYLFWNSITIKKIILSSFVTPYFPSHIEDVSLLYSVMNPTHIYASIKGDFGSATLLVDFLHRSVTVVLQASKMMQKRYASTLSIMKKEQNGEYRYEQSF